MLGFNFKSKEKGAKRRLKRQDPKSRRFTHFTQFLTFS